jgi:hypothetical protein
MLIQKRKTKEFNKNGHAFQAFSEQKTTAPSRRSSTFSLLFDRSNLLRLWRLASGSNNNQVYAKIPRVICLLTFTFLTIDLTPETVLLAIRVSER